MREEKGTLLFEMEGNKRRKNRRTKQRIVPLAEADNVFALHIFISQAFTLQQDFEHFLTITQVTVISCLTRWAVIHMTPPTRTALTHQGTMVLSYHLQVSMALSLAPIRR